MDTETVIVSAVVGVATSVITAYITTRLKMNEERKKWNRELTLKYAEATVVNREVADTLARQFATGFLAVKQIVGERDKVFDPNGSRITIGRDPGRCQVVLNDQSVSGVAATVESDGASIFVVDLHTTNGTFLNGVRLAAGLRTKLKSGDVIKIGHTELTFQSMESID